MEYSTIIHKNKTPYLWIIGYICTTDYTFDIETCPGMCKSPVTEVRINQQTAHACQVDSLCGLIQLQYQRKQGQKYTCSA